jgi:hypothetical protein
MSYDCMEERIKRGYNLLVEEAKEWDYEFTQLVLYEDYKDEEALLRWIRNVAKLWVGFEKDEDWVINGIDFNPNHPDNVSKFILDLWRDTYSHTRTNS